MVSGTRPETFDYPLFSIDHGGAWVDVTEPRLLLGVPNNQLEVVPNVGVKVLLSPNARLGPLVASAIHQLERDTTMADLELTPVEDFDVDGVDARLVRFSFTLPSSGSGAPEQRMRCAQVFFIRRELTFLVTFTAAAADFETVEPWFHELLKSFRFRDPGP